MKNILFTILFLLVIIHVKGQETEFLFPSFSPKGNISQIVGNTLIEVEYERPSARKRQIFGSLVPWNKIWRTGAGNCSKIRFNKDVEIGGQKIPTGNYSIFTIPNTIAKISKTENSNGVSKFSGTVNIYDSFVTKKPLLLNVRVEKQNCEQNNRTIILFRFSPKEFDNVIWNTLEKIKIQKSICH